MLFSRVLSAAVAVGRVLAAPTEDNALARQDDYSELNINPKLSPVEALEELQAAVEGKINSVETERSSGRCSPANARIRKDWYVNNPH